MRWSVLLCCAVGLWGPQTAGAVPSCTSPTWVGSWMAAPSDSVDQPLTNQTVRMIIAPHLSGSRVRVHLTNRFGDVPLTIAHATIAGDGGGGALTSGTLRELTFAGRQRVTIPTGGEIVSDPVNERVVPFSKLAVSLAISGTVNKPTEHFNTREINYSTAPGSGDHTTDPTGGAFTASGGSGTSTGWYFLEGLDVQAPARTGAVVTFGDSITDGFQGRITPVTEDFSTVGQEKRYPDLLQRRLTAAGLPLSVLNAGISGNRILQDGQIPQFGPKALDRLNLDAIHQAGVRDVIILEGINDIGQANPGSLTAQQLIDGYTQLLAQLHAAHLRVLLGTLTPAGGTVIPGYGMTADQIRDPVNQWIRTQKLADAVIDFDAAVRDPTDPSRLNPAYDGSDHLHFSAAGYQALANAVPLNELATPACTAHHASLSVKARPTRVRARRAITIRVSARADGHPVWHARVRLARRSAYTNARGLARLRVTLPHAGRYRLTVTAHGFAARKITIKASRPPHRRRDRRAARLGGLEGSPADPV